MFFFQYTQIKSESFLEDLNNILNAGDVPNIFAQDELDTIYTAMKPVVLDLGLQPTKANLYSAFTKRVRANTHSCVCMRCVSCGLVVINLIWSFFFIKLELVSPLLSVVKCMLLLYACY